MHVWTLRQVARAAGRSPATALSLARAGLLPGYVSGTGQTGAAIPEELAEAYAVALREGIGTSRLANRMRDEPHQVLAAAEALATLARAAMQDQGGKAA